MPCSTVRLMPVDWAGSMKCWLSFCWLPNSMVCHGHLIQTLLYNKSWLLSLPVNCNQIQIPGSEICCSPREDSKCCNFTLYKRVPICSFSVPVCPHAGGVALCELVQHLSMFDFVCVSGTMENRFVYSLFFSE